MVPAGWPAGGGVRWGPGAAGSVSSTLPPSSVSGTPPNSNLTVGPDACPMAARTHTNSGIHTHSSTCRERHEGGDRRAQAAVRTARGLAAACVAAVADAAVGVSMRYVINTDSCSRQGLHAHPPPPHVTCDSKHAQRHAPKTIAHGAHCTQQMYVQRHGGANNYLTGSDFRRRRRCLARENCINHRHAHMEM